MKKNISNIIPVGAPWSGPESFKFLSCFTSAYIYIDKIDCTGTIFCDRDDRLCTRCGECGVTEWENKYHEQIYRDFLTLSGVSCYAVWSKDYANMHLSDNPLAYTDDDYINRTMKYAGYTYQLLQDVSEEEMKEAIVASIDRDTPLLAYNLVNNDWCLVTGYDLDGELLFGKYTPESWDDPQKKPDTVIDGVFTKAKWFNPSVRLLLFTGKKALPEDYSEVLHHMKIVLQQPPNTRSIAGLPVYDAVKSSLLDDDYFATASQEALTRLFWLTHIFIGVLAESRCFAAFSVWSGLFGKITDPILLPQVKKIGDGFMDTHNNCWGAWAAMGKDHIFQPELYLDKFIQVDTRKKLAEYMDTFKANDEKAIQILSQAIPN